MNPQIELQEMLSLYEKPIKTNQIVLWLLLVSLFLPLFGLDFGALWAGLFLALIVAFIFRYVFTAKRNGKIQSFISQNTETGIVLQNFAFSPEGVVSYIPFSDITHVYVGPVARFARTKFSQIDPDAFKKGKDQIPNIFRNAYGHMCLVRLKNQEIHSFPNNSAMQSSNVLMYSNGDVLQVKSKRHGISLETGAKK